MWLKKKKKERNRACVRSSHRRKSATLASDGSLTWSDVGAQYSVHVRFAVDPADMAWERHIHKLRSFKSGKHVGVFAEKNIAINSGY